MNELPESRINQSAIKAWRITAALFGMILFIVPAGLYFFYKVEGINLMFSMIAAPVSLVLYAILVSLFPKIRWSRWRYEVSDQGVDIYRGIIIRKRTMVPMNRIQHVDTKQGPVYRKFGLSSISISTAATTHEIPALDDQTATNLRVLISELVRKAREDV